MLLKEINRRKLADWQMQLAIVQNPYSKKPKELWDILKGQERRSEDIEYDAAGLERLKQNLRQSGKVVVK